MAAPAVAEPDAAPPAQPPDRRLNPFVLPTSTTSRFLLLIVLVLAAAASTYDVVAAADWAGRYSRCAVQARADVGDGGTAARFLTCFEAVGRDRAVRAATGSVLVALALLLGWFAHPILLARRQGLAPLDAGSHPRSAHEIARLVTEAGLSRPPEILVDLRTAPGGRAFGRWPRYRVRLSLGLLRAAEKGDPAPLRAILRHELAHLRNRDVDLAALTLVVWWAFLLTVAVPLLAVTALTAPDQLWAIGWRLAAVLVAVRLVRAATLRSREHDADVRASVGRAAGEARFDAACFPDPPEPTGLRASLRRPAAHHPQAARRAAVVAAPHLLLRAGTAEAAATGLTVGIAVSDLHAIMVSLTGDIQLGGLLSGFVLGALTASVVGTGLWRETLRALALRTPLPTGTGPGLGLAAGILAGQLASPQRSGAVWAHTAGAAPMFAALYVVLLVAACVGFTRWIIGGAAAWLGRGWGSPTRALWLGRAAVTVVAAAGLGFWMNLAGVTDPLGLAIILAAAGLFISLTLAAIVVVAHHLAAELRRPGPGAPLLLDGDERIALPAVRQRAGLVLGVPAVVGALALVVDRLLPAGIVLGVQGRLGGNTQIGVLSAASGFTVLVLFAGTATLLAAVAGVVAGLTAGRDGAGLGAVHGLGAALLTAVLLAAVLFLARVPQLCSLGCEPLFLFTLSTWAPWALSALALTATAAVTPLVAVGHALARRTGPTGLRWPASAPAHTPPARLWGRVAAGSALTVLALLSVALGVAWAQTIGLAPVPRIQPHEHTLAAPPPPPPGSVAVPAACDAANTASTALGYGAVGNPAPTVAGARAAAGTADPALRAMGAELLAGLRVGASWEPSRNLIAITRYCAVARDGPV